MRTRYHGVAWVVVNNKIENNHAGRWINMYPTKREAIEYLDSIAKRVGDNEWKNDNYESLGIKKEC